MAGRWSRPPGRHPQGSTGSGSRHLKDGSDHLLWAFVELHGDRVGHTGLAAGGSDGTDVEPGVGPQGQAAAGTNGPASGRRWTPTRTTSDGCQDTLASPAVRSEDPTPSDLGLLCRAAGIRTRDLWSPRPGRASFPVPSCASWPGFAGFLVRAVPSDPGLCRTVRDQSVTSVFAESFPLGSGQDGPPPGDEPFHGSVASRADGHGLWSHWTVDRGRPWARPDADVKKSTSILERPVYGIAEAAGLLGLRPDRTHAWLDGYGRRGVPYAPVNRPEPTGGDIVTWGEFVELGYLREYRRKGVPLQRLRPVIDELRREFTTPYPWPPPGRSSSARSSCWRSRRRTSSPPRSPS